MAKLRLCWPGQKRTMIAARIQIKRHCEEFGRHTTPRFYVTPSMAGKAVNSSPSSHLAESKFRFARCEAKSYNPFIGSRAEKEVIQ